MQFNQKIKKLLDQIFADQVVPGLTLLEDATWLHVKPGGYDPATGRFTSALTTEIPVQVFRQQVDNGALKSGGSQIQVSETWFWLKPLDALSFDDYSDDRLKVGSEEFQIIEVQRRNLGPTPLFMVLRAVRV